MTPSSYWSVTDLRNLSFGGHVAEDVMREIINITPADTFFSEGVGSSAAANNYTEWVEDALAAPNLNNAWIEGQDTVGQNDARGGSRAGNHIQRLGKVIQVTSGAREVETFGRADEFAYQLSLRLIEARKDLEAIALHVQASAQDNNNDTAGKLGSFGSFLKTNTDHGAGGSAGGFANGAVTAPTAGTARALSEAKLRELSRRCYEAGGNPRWLMARPIVIERVSDYQFTASARVATLVRETVRDRVATSAMGAVNVLIYNHGVQLELISNRTMQARAANVSQMYGIDPDRVVMSWLRNWVTEPLAKTGLADKSQIRGAVTCKPLAEKAHFGYYDIDENAAMTA